MEVAESVFQNVKELEEAKQKVKPEAFLAAILEKIRKAEEDFKARRIALEAQEEEERLTYERTKQQKIDEIKILDSSLVFKREERAELLKPLDSKRIELTQWEERLKSKEEVLDTETQNAMRKEKEYESKLDSVRDMADELGEQRVKIQVRERMLDGKEEKINDSEMKHLVRISQWNEQEANLRNDWQAREYAVALREVSLEGKEENLVKREKQLSDGLLWLQDQRGVLARAWKELNRK